MHDPFKDDEKLKIREQYRYFESERFFVAVKMYAAQVHDQRMFALSCIREYGVLTIRSMLLLNGGSILALLTFVGSFFAKNDQTIVLIGISIAQKLRVALYYYAAGLSISSLVAGLTYMNWLSVHATYQDPGRLHGMVLSKEPIPIHPGYGYFANISAGITILLGFLVLGCFLAGSYDVARAFAVLGA